MLVSILFAGKLGHSKNKHESSCFKKNGIISTRCCREKICNVKFCIQKQRVCPKDERKTSEALDSNMDNKSRKTFVPKDMQQPPLARHMCFFSLGCSFQIPRRRTPHHLATEKMGKRQSDLRRQLQLFEQGRLGNAKAAQWEVEMEHPTAGGLFQLEWSEHEQCSLRDPHLLFIFLFEVQSSQSRNGGPAGRNPNLTGFPGSWYPRIYRQTSQQAGFQDWVANLPRYGVGKHTSGPYAFSGKDW